MSHESGNRLPHCFLVIGKTAEIDKWYVARSQIGNDQSLGLRVSSALMALVNLMNKIVMLLLFKSMHIFCS